MSKIEVTVFRKTGGGLLSKRISLLKSGKVKSDGSECRMTEGRARRVKLNGAASLAKLLETMPAREALALGRLRPGLPKKVNVVLKRHLSKSPPPDTIARTNEYLLFAAGKPAYMLLDHDRKGMAEEVAAKLKADGGFWKTIKRIVPGLAGAAYVIRGSTSSGLSNSKTGKKLKGSAGLHVYIPIEDGADVDRALKTLHERLWLAQYGYYVIGTAGQLLDRSIIDASVYGAERLVFEGAPEIVAPLTQDQEVRRPKAYKGAVVDSRRAIPPLSEKEEVRLAQLKERAATRMKGEVEVARKVWAKQYAAKHGLSQQEAERITTQATRHILEPRFELVFDELGTCTVADVLERPRKYLNETLADPLDGPVYGRGKAKVFRQHDRCLMIHSFAHGGIKYQLAGQGVRLEDFRAYKPLHNYVYTPTREPWPAVSVNATIPSVPLFDTDGRPVLDRKGNQQLIAANQWLDQHQSVEQMTWAPGHDMEVKDQLVADGGWIRRNGVTTLNLYRPPDIKPGDATKAGPWLEHVHKVYPTDAEHIINWLAHRVQYPDEKINHALALGGMQGIGKDTMLEPVKYAVGPWNFREVSPKQVMGRFNGFLKSVILRISEARDLGEYDRYAFYDHMKAYTAAPPDVLLVDEKNLREHSIFNVCGIIITTNHKTNGIYLDADDRRHYVAWSDLTKENFDADYWNELWSWYGRGGKRHVATYLHTLDISEFDAKAPPPKTDAFLAIVDVGRAPEEAELADLLDKLQNPDAVTLADLKGCKFVGADLAVWLTDRKNRRVIPHRLEACGYVSVRNDDAKDGMWVKDGQRQVIYVKSDMGVGERMRAARKHARGKNR